MKKLERKQISELRKTMPILGKSELQSIIGGDGTRYNFDENGNFISSGEYLDGSNSGVTCDIICISGTEIILNGPLEDFHEDNGNVSFKGSAELFEFLVEHSSCEWGYAYNSGEDSGQIGNSGETHRFSPRDCSWKQYDNCAHSHYTGLDISESEKDEINGRPSQADIDDLMSTNAWRKKQGLPPQSGIIYDERAHKWIPFGENSSTQEDYLRSQGYIW